MPNKRKTDAPQGRRKKAKYEIKNLVKVIDEYVDSRLSDKTVNFLSLKECCLLNNLNAQYVYWLSSQEKQDTAHFTEEEIFEKNLRPLSTSIQRLYNLRECYLEKGSIVGVFNSHMSKFLLKQPIHGYVEDYKPEDNSNNEIIKTLATNNKLLMEVLKKDDNI